MRCPTCENSGWPGWVRGRPLDWMPCPECYGRADASCCDGAVGGPYDVTNAPSAVGRDSQQKERSKQ
jgi:hypothetical protein